MSLSPDASQPNEAVKLFYRAIGTNQPELFDQVLAPDWQDIPLGPGQSPGRDGFKPMVAGFHQTFHDLKITTDDIICSGDKIVVRSTLEATQAGDFGGFPPMGRRFTIMAIDIHQLGNGKIIKTWHLEDWLGGLFQMGAFEK